MRRILDGRTWKVVCFLVTVLVGSRSHAAINPKDVAGVWLFDENKGNTANDASGNGNKGTFQGDVKWVPGKFGSAVAFDGTGATFVQVPSSDSLNMTKEVSVVFWVKTTKKMVDMWGDRQAVVGKHYLEYEVGIYMNGQIHTYTSDGAGNYDEGIMTSFNGKLPEGDADWVKDKWYHVAWTLKDQHEIAYVNGIKLAEYDKAHAGTKPGTHPVEIGRRVGGGIPVLGAVDEVGIFRVALSEADINVIYQRGLSFALGISPVEPKDKLATRWAEMKAR